VSIQTLSLGFGFSDHLKRQLVEGLEMRWVRMFRAEFAAVMGMMAVRNVYTSTMVMMLPMC
jgi:hypothetical protein